MPTVPGARCGWLDSEALKLTSGIAYASTSISSSGLLQQGICCGRAGTGRAVADRIGLIARVGLPVDVAEVTW